MNIPQLVAQNHFITLSFILICINLSNCRYNVSYFNYCSYNALQTNKFLDTSNNDTIGLRQYKNNHNFTNIAHMVYYLSSVPILPWDSTEQISVKCYLKFKSFNSRKWIWKYRVRNDKFVAASITWNRQLNRLMLIQRTRVQHIPQMSKRL